MPFGLCNAPATFQMTMDFVLQDLRGMAGAYVDDILTGTDTLDDMVFALREVYVRLAKHKLYAAVGSGGDHICDGGFGRACEGDGGRR